jgi:hypothetical protein
MAASSMFLMLILKKPITVDLLMVLALFSIALQVLSNFLIEEKG